MDTSIPISFYNKTMGSLRDRILIVEHDPIISDLLGRQALQAAGYQVQIVGDASIALMVAEKYSPELMLIELNLPGLSGKDLVIALRTQGIEIPVVVIAARGLENEAIQAFRLGATDSITWPAREAEVVAVVERVLKQVHENRERIQAVRQLHKSNQELQERVRELTNIYGAGKAILALDDPRSLNERILDWTLRAAEADSGWFLLRDDPSAKFTLVAARNLPVERPLNQVWEDDMSTLVGLSGEPLSVYGEPLKRFKTSNLGQSILLIPIRIQKQTVGALGLARKAARMFTDSDQNVIKAMAEYTSQALLNMRLLRGFEERSRSLQRIAETAQAGEKAKAETLLNIVHELRSIEDAAQACLKQAVEIPQTGLSANTRQYITSAQEKLAQAVRVIDLVLPLAQSNLSYQAPTTNASDIARQVIPQFQRRAQQQGVTLLSELPGEAILVRSDPAQLFQILSGLVANAVRVSLPGGKVILRLERGIEKQANITIRDSGPGIEARDLPHIFERTYYKEDSPAYRPTNDGISLPLIRELVSAYGGTIWVESKLGQGSIFHFTLPAAR